MAKTYNQKIDRNTAWGGDMSTSGLPVAGGRVQEFIKDELNTKAGSFYRPGGGGFVYCFATKEDKEAYKLDPINNEHLIIDSFETESMHSVIVNSETLVTSKSIIEGTTGNTIYFQFRIVNKDGFTSDSRASITFTFNSSGIIQKYTMEVLVSAEGWTTVVSDVIDKYLRSGVNSISINIRGISTNASTEVVLTYNVFDFVFEILDFKYNTPKNNVLSIPYHIKCSEIKYLEFLIDGNEVHSSESQTIVDSEKDGTATINITGLGAGQHSLQVRSYIKVKDAPNFYSDTFYFTFAKNGEAEPSFLMAIRLGSTQCVVTEENVLKINTEQFEQISFNWSMYDYLSRRLIVNFEFDGDVVSRTEFTLNGSINEFTFRPFTYGENKVLRIFAVNGVGDLVFEHTILFDVNGNDSGLKETVDGILLKLTANGRRNSDIDRDVWACSGTDQVVYSATFNGFDWTAQQGWNEDEEALVISDGAYVDFNIRPMNNQWQLNGGTFEIDLETFDVENEDAVICECQSHISGSSTAYFRITATNAEFSTANNVKINTRYKDGERLKIAFIGNKTASTVTEDSNMIYIMVNGVLERAAMYTNADMIWSAESLRIGSPDGGCKVKLRSIRVYNRAISVDEEFNNFVVDSDDSQIIYERNNIFKERTEEVGFDEIANKLPVMIFTGDMDDIVKNGQDKQWRTFDVEYINRQEPERNFVAFNCEMKLQGTSSLGYPRKNFKLKTKNKLSTESSYLSSNYELDTTSEGNVRLKDKTTGRLLEFGEYTGGCLTFGCVTSNNEVFWKLLEKGKYRFRAGSHKANKWTLKADYMESSCSHNVGAGRSWNEIFKMAKLPNEYPGYTNNTYKNSALITNSEYLEYTRSDGAVCRINMNTESMHQQDNFVCRTDAQKICVSEGLGGDYVRTAVDGFPMVCFYRTKHKNGTNDLVFMGQYNFINDKASYEVFGFEDIEDPNDESENPVLIYDASKVECWEGLKNTSRISLFKSLDGWNTSDGWSSTFESRYPELKDDDGGSGDRQPNAAIGSPLYELCSWIVSTRHEDDTEIDHNNTITIDASFAKKINTYEYAYPNPNDARPEDLAKYFYLPNNANSVTVSDTPENRQRKFEVEKWEHFDVWKLAGYYIYLMRYGAVDQFVKNTMLFTDGNGKYDTRTANKYRKWFYINYDNDCLFGLRNNGELAFHWKLDRQTLDNGGDDIIVDDNTSNWYVVYDSDNNVIGRYQTEIEAQAVVDEDAEHRRIEVEDSEDETVNTYAMMGHDSTLWNNLERDEEFMRMVRDLDDAMNKSGLNYKNMVEEFDTKQTEQWCERIYNANERYKYIQAAKGIGDMSGNPKDNLWMLQGTRRSHRHWWIANHFNMLDAQWLSGEYKRYYVQIKTDATAGASIRAVAGDDYYFAWGQQKRIFESNIRKAKGEEIIFTLPDTFDASTQGDPIYIYAYNKMSELDTSSIANKIAAGSFDFNEGEIDVINTLKKLIIGNPSQINYVTNFTTTSTWGKLPNLEYLDITNFTGISEIPFNSLRNLHTFKAFGSGMSSFIPVDGSWFDLVELPNTIGTLTLKNVGFDNIFTNLQYTPTTILYHLELSRTNGIGMDYFNKLVYPWLTLLNESLESDALYMLAYLELGNVDWAFSNFAYIELFEKISAVSRQKEALNPEDKSFIINGVIDLSGMNTIEMDRIEKIKEIFGENCFDQNDSQIYIKVPKSVFIKTNSQSMAAGKTNIFSREVYPAENALPEGYRIEYYIVEETDDVQEYYDAVNNKHYKIVNDPSTIRPGISITSGMSADGKEIGILTSLENEYADTDLSVMCLLVMSGVYNISVCNFKIKKPTYAVSTGVTIEGEKSLYKENEYVFRAVLKDSLGREPIGSEHVDWTITMDNIGDYLTSYGPIDENGLEYKIVTSLNQPDSEQISVNIHLSIDVTNGNGTVIRGKTFDCMLLNENVIMTRATNQVMLDICNNTWPSIFYNSNAITRTQAERITNISNAFANITASTTFNEFKYFTGVTELPDGAFDASRGLTEISIPETVTGMGISVFNNCKNLKKISFGDNPYTLPNVSKIKEATFKGCNNLKKLRLPNSVTEIDKYAFGKTGFKRVMLSTCDLEDEVLLLPSGITKVWGSAFELSTWSVPDSSNDLITFSIPKTLQLSTDEEKNVLRGKRYKEYLVEEGHTGYISEDGILYSSENGVEKSQLVKYPAEKNENLTDFDIPNVTSISNYAFLYCSNLGRVVIPNSVKEHNIGINCFRSSSVRQVVLSDATSLKGIPDYCFYDCLALTDVYLPVSNQFERLGSYAFYNCPSLTGITLPNGITELGANGNIFYNCGFSALTLPDTITTMDINTVVFCQNLEWLKLPKKLNLNISISSLYDAVIKNCNSLTEIVLPAFSYYDSITYDAYYEDGTLYNSGYATLELAENDKPENGYVVTVYGNNVVVNETMNPQFVHSCPNLTRFALNDDDNGLVGGIYDNSIYNVVTKTLIRVPYKKSTINIMPGTEIIGGSSFRDCTLISEIVFPESTRILGDYSLWNCTSLSSINIPDSISSIGGRCFLNCSNLRSLTIGRNVGRISYLAFGGCVKMETITFLRSTACTLENSTNNTFHPFGSQNTSYAGHEKCTEGTNRIYIPYNSVGYDNEGDVNGNNKWIGDPITDINMCGYSYGYLPYNSTFAVKIYNGNGQLVTSNVYAKSQRGEFASNGNDYEVGVYISESESHVFTSSNDDLYDGETLAIYSSPDCDGNSLLGEITLSYGTNRYQIGNMSFGLRGGVEEQRDKEYVTLTKDEYDSIMSNIGLLNKILINGTLS